MTTDAAALEAVERMRVRATRTSEVIDQYYTLCINFYREFLGDHWHTGYYLLDNQPIGLRDQLRMERHIAASVRLSQDCQVLDVGCGIGGPACHLARLTGARIHGLTPNRAQLELARGLAVNAKVADRVTFDQGSASSLPYSDASFDEADRADVSQEKQRTSDPIHATILEGLLRLGEAAAAGAFTVGRFLAAKKQASPPAGRHA